MCTLEVAQHRTNQEALWCQSLNQSQRLSASSGLSTTLSFLMTQQVILAISLGPGPRLEVPLGRQ